MTREKIKEIHEDFKNALERLKEALKEEPLKILLLLMGQYKDSNLLLNYLGS